MERVPFGRTGLLVSRLGLGAGRLGELSSSDATRLLDRALDLGVTLYDTAPSYGDSEARLAAWARGAARARALVSTKVGYGVPGVPDWTGEAISRGLERAARHFGGHVDVAHLHSCPGETALRDDVLEALRRALDGGWLRVAAYSGENEDLDAAISSPVFGAVQVSVNIVDQGTRELRSAHFADRGLGVLAKRPLGNAPWAAAPDVAGPEAEYAARFRRLSLSTPDEGWPGHALRFAAFSPGVHSVLVGTRSAARLDEAALAVSRGPLPPPEERALVAAWRAHAAGWRGVV